MGKNDYLVFDIGGTFIKYALMDEDSNFIEKDKIKTPQDTMENFIETIGKVYDKYSDKIQGIAISMPGIVDNKTGYAKTGGALTYISEVNIVDIIKTRCNTKITIENDGKCAALAEVWKGTLKDVKNGIVIVLGTGVGGGIIIDRKVYKGTHFFAGEFSYMRTNAADSMDISNMWAAKSGAKNLASEYAKAKNVDKATVDGYKVFEDINAGDEEALKVLDDFTNTIAVEIINLQAIVDPEKVSIGGGISAQPLLIDYINKNLERNYNVFPLYMPKVKVEKCTFENDSNLIGALYNFMTV